MKRCSVQSKVLLGIVCLVLCLSGCVLKVRRAPVATYTVDVGDPALQCVTVRAEFSRLAPGDVELVLPRSRDGRRGVAELVWIRAFDSSSSSGESAASGSIQTLGIDQWLTRASRSGRLTIEYRLRLGEQRGAVHSTMTTEQVILLTHAILVVPADWLGDLRRPLSDRVSVAIRVPDDWAIYSPWPYDPSVALYRPQRLEDLIDSAIVAGRMRGYELADEAFCVRLLVPRDLSLPLADERLPALSYVLRSVYDLYGTAPDLGKSMTMWVVLHVDASATGFAEARGFGDNMVVIRTGPDLPIALDLAALRESLALWNGAAVRAMPPWASNDADGRTTLLAGLNEYLAWRMLLQARRVTPIQYWNHLRALAHAMQQDSRVAALGFDEAARAMPRDMELAWLLRARGHLYGMLLDQRLQQDTDSRLDLATVLRGLHESHNFYATGELLAWEDFEAYLTDVTGHDYGGLYGEFIRSGDASALVSVPRLAGSLASETRSVLTPDGVRLAYQWVDGESDRVSIYLSDGPGRTPYDWMLTLAEHLRPFLDVAYLDQRGAGRSVLPASGMLSLDAFVDDIEMVRQDTGADRIVLIGHSWGGYLALTYASRYPERVDALILLAPIPSYQRVAREATVSLVRRSAGSIPLDYLVDGVDSPAEWQALGSLAADLGLYGSDLLEVEAVRLRAYGHYVDTALLPRGLRLDNRAVLPVLIARDDLLHRDSLADMSSAELDYDVLMIRGQRDALISSDVLLELQGIMGGEIIQISDSGHYLYLDTPAAVMNTMIGFLVANQ